MGPEIERHLRWLMVLRLATVSTLLLSVFIIDLVFTPTRSPVPFYSLALFTFVLSLAYGVMFKMFRMSRIFLLLQLFGDALVITGVVHLTGGPESPFSFLYIVAVLAASVLLYRRGAFWIAGWCWLLYAAVMWITYFDWLPLARFSPAQEAGLNPSRLLYLLVVHFVGFFLAAFLASYVSENLRKTREELLKNQDQVSALRTYHENIIHSTTSGLVTTDVQGRVNFVNRGAMQILDRSMEQLEGRIFPEFLQRELTFLPDLLARLEEVPRVRFDSWFQKGEDERVFLGFTVSRLRDKAENFLGFIFSFQDLTDRKALEEEVQLRQRMAAIGGIAAGMAHEIRNPLASITGSVQLLKRELPMEPTHQELMQIILTESKRLDGILRDFLSYARPGRVDPESVDVVVLVREAVQLLKNSEECHTGHRIRTRFQAESIHAVLDTNRIRQVIWNLARNGLKSMPAGGTLTIGVEERPAGGLAIFFQDEGIGMTEKEIENCFQPFRGGFSQGTGLGLSIVYRVVEEHEGKIQIESEKNKGTRVEVFLPAERKLFVTVGA